MEGLEEMELAVESLALQQRRLQTELALPLRVVAPTLPFKRPRPRPRPRRWAGELGVCLGKGEVSLGDRRLVVVVFCFVFAGP